MALHAEFRFGVRLFREPDAGNPPVRFDEREEETELSQTGLRRRGESPANRHREATVTAPLLDSTHPIKEDVKKKVFSSPLAGGVGVWLASSRVSLLEGLLIFPLWLAAHSSGEADPSCLSQLTGFMKRWRSTPFGSRSYASRSVG